MKLRNLMYATMIACAFASCSKDDEVINNGGETAGTAKLDLQINVPATKAIGDANVDDKAYSTLNVYVFNDQGTIEAKESTTAGQAGSATSRLTEKLTAGQKKVVVFANYALKATTYDAMLTETKTINGEVNGALSMNSKVYDVTLQAGKTNFLGYAQSAVPTTGNYLSAANGNPVYLYRNVAKIVLKKINFTPSATKYTGATLKIENVYLLHGKTNSLIATAGEWGATGTTTQEYTNGVDATAYQAWVTAMTGKTAIKDKEYLATSATKAQYSNYIETKTADAYSPNALIENLGSFYAFENAAGDNNTLLVVAAKMAYGDITMENAETRYYSVAIGVDGMETGTYYTGANTYALNNLTRTATGKVVRNIEYDVTLGIVGPGWDTPFGPDPTTTTKLDVKVEVVPFGTVNQSPVIE